MGIKTRLQDPLVRAGRWVLIIGTGPLLLVALLDLLGLPVSDNPIGLALLFIISAPVGAVLLIVGFIRGRPASWRRLDTRQYRWSGAYSKS